MATPGIDSIPGLYNHFPSRGGAAGPQTVVSVSVTGKTGQFTYDLVGKANAFGSRTGYASLNDAVTALSALTAAPNSAAAVVTQEGDRFYGHQAFQTWNEGPDSWRNDYDAFTAQGDTLRALSDAQPGVQALVLGKTVLRVPTPAT